MSSQGLETAFAEVSKLAARFKAGEARYLSPDYQEAQARKDFIDKFFIALGWDVNHEEQTNPYEQEVKVEQNVSVAARQRRADYAFYLAPNFRDVRFFVEAKKPAGDIATADNYFQVIRYGWNSQTPFAVLTDFEQFHVLNCRYKPDIDTALHRAYAKYHYSEYANRDKFAEIYWLFSREAVADRSLEKRAAELPKPRGKAVQRALFPGAFKPVDESFLAELDEYRSHLARAFKNKNPRLDSPTLTELTQRTLDRLVFMRFLEDKGIEPHRFVDKFGDKAPAWESFVAASRRLDGIYNGIVFKRHDILDAPTFRVGADVFADICEGLAHINSPYDFNAIPIHILGSIYERFLGKVIVATEKRARVEEKPEVRKAGGVYYTPEYIVRYIVENTVGKLIAGKPPDQIAEMRFADIACGSGSFLLGIYDLLLQYHGNYYNAHPTKAREGDCIEREGKLYLSLHKKREILLNNIYGVDIDAQAVEVAQLSLYLKLLQEETTASAHAHQLEFHETLLPSLAKNIVCGNSLIGTDILEGKLFASDEERKLNPMNFEDTFPHIFKRGLPASAGTAKEGGFDAIVGNPPWGASFGEVELAYFRSKYQRVIARMVDSYIYFLDRALQLVPEHGLVGYIIPTTLLNQVDAKPVRNLLLSRGLSSLVSLGTGVFGSKVLNTSTIVITGKREDGLLVLDDLSLLPSPEREKALTTVKAKSCKDWAELVARDAHCTFFVNKQDASALLMKLREKHRSLGSLISGGIQRGVTPDIAEAHVVAKSAARALKLEAEMLRPSVSGPQIKRYQDWKSDQFIIYTTRETPIRKYPCAAKYIGKFRAQNSCPEVKQGKHPWWALHRPRDPQIFTSPKIIGLTTTKTIELIYDPKHSVCVTDAMYVFHPPADWDPWTIMAIMQSKLFLFLYRTANQGESRVIPQVKASKLETLPVSLCNTSHPQSQRLRELAGQMLSARTELAKAKTDKDKTYYGQKCISLDRQIDRLVYDLYGLTQQEIEIVERALGETPSREMPQA
jgi:adenine-specific DNA-methyltransferase